MKKLLTLAIVSIMALGASAQDWFAGGTVGFWRNSTANTTEFSILPEVGYNLNEHLAIATTLGYTYNYNDGYSLDLVQFNPYARYTFLKFDRVSLFADGGVDLGFGSGGGDVAVTFGIGVKPGVAFRINDRFSLVAHLGFLGFRGGNDASRAHNQGGFMVSGNDLNLGFYVNF